MDSGAAPSRGSRHLPGDHDPCPGVVFCALTTSQATNLEVAAAEAPGSSSSWTQEATWAASPTASGEVLASAVITVSSPRAASLTSWRTTSSGWPTGSSTVRRTNRARISGGACSMTSWRGSRLAPASTLEGGPLEFVTEQGGLQVVGHLLGPVDGQPQGFETRAELLDGPAAAVPAGTDRTMVGGPAPAAVESVGVPVAVHLGLAHPGIVRATRRPTAPPITAVARWRPSRSAAAGHRLVGPGPRRTDLLQPLPQEEWLEAAALGHLHQVLVTDQVVGMLGHCGQGRVGGPGPALGGTQLGRGEDPLHPELEKGLGPDDCGPQPLGIAPGQFAGVGAGRQGGHGHVDRQLALPLVEAAGGRLTGAVGVEGQHHPRGEAPEQLHVLLGQGRPAGGHRPLHARPEQPDDIGVPLADHDLVGGDDRPAWPS